jgi:hypothetical protein
MTLIQVLYSVEALAREANMTSLERHQLRLEKSLPIINQIGQYIRIPPVNCISHFTDFANGYLRGNKS